MNSLGPSSPGAGPGAARRPDSAPLARPLGRETRSFETLRVLGGGIAAEPASWSRPAAKPRCQFSIDRDWRILTISPEAAAWSVTSPIRLVGADIRERWPMATEVIEAVETCFATGAPSTAEIMSTRAPSRRLRFEVLPFKGGAHVHFEEIPGKAVGRAVPETWGELHAPAFGSGAAGIVVLDESGRIVAANTAWRATVAAHGLASMGDVGHDYVELATRAVPNLDGTALLDAIEDLIRGRSSRFCFVYKIDTPLGAQPRQVEITPLRIGTSTYCIASHEDLTEVALAQDALRKASDELLHAREDERQRIATEIHDSTGQYLTAMAMNLSRLQRLMAKRDDIVVGDLLTDMAATLHEAIKGTRVLSYLLTPTELEKSGLAEAARRFVEGFGRRTGISAAFRAEGPVDRADPTVRHAVFRVIQEALTNVHRHAGASEIGVVLSARGGMLSARVCDNGCGMDLAAVERGQGEASLGVGILGMRARLLQLDGRLSIESSAGGTVVIASAPAGPAA